jgi:CRP-like cAMP-binding protein
LDDDALTRLAAAGRRRAYRKGQYIFFQGDSGDTLLVVCGGLVKVVFMSAAGEETVLVTSATARLSADRAPGRAERSASVVAGSRRRPAPDPATVLDAMVRHPAVLDAMLRSLASWSGGSLSRQVTSPSSTSAADSRGAPSPRRRPV